MRVLLSTIGSRGDVQPLVALALELRSLGQEVRLCVPPDFREWIEELGFAVTPVGPELRRLVAAGPGAVFPPGKGRELAQGTVAAQFAVLPEAARGCDLIVGATALQIAAPTVAEAMGIPYVFVVYCPTVLPSPHHAPPPLPPRPEDAALPAPADHCERWERHDARFADTFGAALGARRAALGLAAVEHVRRHVFTDRPWLAADATLGPWPAAADDRVVQTGAWMIADDRPLSPDLNEFLEAGAPPIYFGLGSQPATQDVGRIMVETARALGRRTIVSSGWAGLAPEDVGADLLVIGEVNQQALFPRVAAVVHHGGAGTTTAASASGAPQVVVPQGYDQRYWAGRVEQLGIGFEHTAGSIPSVASLTDALERTLQPDVAERARSVAAAVVRDGARAAARRLVAEFGGSGRG